MDDLIIPAEGFAGYDGYEGGGEDVTHVDHDGGVVLLQIDDVRWRLDPPVARWLATQLRKHARLAEGGGR